MVDDTLTWAPRTAAQLIISVPDLFATEDVSA